MMKWIMTIKRKFNNIKEDKEKGEKFVFWFYFIVMNLWAIYASIDIPWFKEIIWISMAFFNLGMMGLYIKFLRKKKQNNNEKIGRL